MKKLAIILKKARINFVAVVVTVLAFSSTVLAPDYSAAAGFIGTGSMTAGRNLHTSTLLSNGKVLVAGGYDGVSTLASAELYDPGTGVFTPAGSMTTARGGHTAVLLPNGKVLVIGGKNGPMLASAELYDPDTNCWSATGSMANSRYLHTATVLPNGKVLVAGGYDGSSYLQSAELYDPGNGTFTTAGTMVTARQEHSAVLLPSGKVLVAGGTDGSYLQSAELYDPAANNWTTANSMVTGRARHTATLLPNGTVLVAGGSSDSGATFTAERYDPASNSWSGAGSLAIARGNHTATLLPNGKVLVTGGDDTGALTSAELYDATANIWLSAGSMAAARNGHAAVLLPSGTLLITGGYDGGNYLNSAEVYDSAVSSWTATGSMHYPRVQPTATLLSNGKVLVTGYTNSSDLYDQTTGTFTETGWMSVPRNGHKATLLATGKVLISGGSYTGALNIAELYDPDTGSINPTGDMNTPRYEHSATLLANGKVLVVGGYDGTNYLDSAELYDPATGTFTTTGSMATARVYHTATLLSSGKVLIAGGSNTSYYLSSAEVYDPVTGTFTAVNSLGNGRIHFSATLLPNGKVLVVGGQGSSGFLTAAELFDPATNNWSTTGNMTNGRARHTATLLAKGTVLVSGGWIGGFSYINGAELYDPITGTFTSAGAMTTQRGLHTASLLPNGKVLIAGGEDGTSSLFSAELFDPGFGFSDSRRSVINTIDSSSGRLAVSGTGFKGDSEASSGGTASSPTNYPLLQLRRLDNEKSLFIVSDPSINWSSTSFTSDSLSDLLPGSYSATIYANAIPSMSSFLVVGAIAGVAPSGLDFGSVATSQTSSPQTVTVINSGNQDLVVSGITTFGGNSTMFNITPATCGSLTPTIPVGSSCTVDVTFTPTSVGTKNTMLSVSSNDPTKPIYAETLLTGTGVLPTYALTVTFAGTGGGSLTITPKPPAIDCTDTCSQSFDEGTAVTLTPTAGSGSVFAGWSGCDSLNGDQCLVTMTGAKSVSPTFTYTLPSIGVAPASRDFGERLVGTGGASLPVTISNSGIKPMVVSGITLSGDGSAAYVVTAVTCGSLTPTIAASSSCTVNVTFSPTAQQIWNASLNVVSNDPVTPNTSVSLTGKGVGVAFNLDLTFSGYGSGSVSFSPGSVCTTNCSQSFAGGTIVQLTPTADSGSMFSSWNGCDSVVGDECDVTMSGVKNITANFTLVNQVAPQWIQTSGPLGQILAFAIDPAATATIYAGTYGSGVFKSTDGGASWSAMNSGLTNHNVQALAIDPAAPATIYAGTDGGVFKSTDGGASWSAVNSGMTNEYVRSLAIDPAAPATIYAGTYAHPPVVTYGGVFKSTDGGASWSLISNGLMGSNVSSLAIDPAAPATIYAGTSGGGVFKSTIGGALWSSANSGLTNHNVQALAIDPAAPVTIYSGTYGGGVFKSTDGGASWSDMISGLTNHNVQALAIDPAAPAVIYAGSDGGGVFKSTDGGASWSAMNTGLTNDYVVSLALDPAAPAAIYAGTNGGGVFKFSLDAAVIDITPSTLSYGSVAIGNASTPQQVTIINYGRSELFVSAINLYAGDINEFSVESGTCPSLTPTLAPTESCTVVISFTPSSNGAKSTTVRIASSDTVTPYKDITISGTGYDPPPYGTITIDGGAAFATSASVMLTLNAFDNSGTVTDMRFSNNNSTWSGWELYGTSKSWNLMTLGGDGTKFVYVQYRDAGGNVSSSFADSIILDITPPVMTITAKPATIYNSKNGSISFTASETATITCSLDGAAATTCTSPWSFTDLADGSHTLAITATDAAGLTGNASHTWTIDTTLPTVTFTSIPSNPSAQASGSFSFTSEAGATFQCSLDSGGWGTCSSPHPYGPLADGIHSLSVRATDLAGNVGSATYNWTINTSSPTVVKIGANTYTTLAAALLAATDGATLQILAGITPEGVKFSGNGIIKLEGGYDGSWNRQPDLFSPVSSLVITSGTVIVDKIKVQ